MKSKNQFNIRKGLSIPPKLALAAVLGAFATSVFARNVPTIPEPSVISMIGVGLVVGIIAYRIKRNK